MKFVYSILAIMLPFLSAMGQQYNSTSEHKSYRSFDLIIVDNSQLSGKGIELSEQQYAKLQSLGEFIENKQDPRNTKFIFYVCNRAEQNDVDNLSSEKRYINELKEKSYDLPAIFVRDSYWILQRLLRKMEPFGITKEISIYYFFPPSYFENGNLGNLSDIAKFVNVLPRQIASLFESDISINVHFYLPQSVQNETDEKLINQLYTIANFKNNDKSYSKINFDVQVAN